MFKRLLITPLFITVFFLGWVGPTFATMYEYSDAPYGVTTHRTDEWQKLGSQWNAESSPKQIDNDASDDGVWWSVNGGAYGNNDVIHVGDQIKFKFEMWSAGHGIHDYDQIKAWVDWDQNGYWDNLGESVLAEQYFKPDNAIHDSTGFTAEQIDQYNALYGTTTYYWTDTFSITDDMIGDLWLRARASCWDTPFEDTNPYIDLYQGEVEDWKISVTSVPEPASFLLLSTCLVAAFYGSSRRKLK